VRREIPGQTGRLIRTVVHLRPAQVASRVRLRSQKAVLSRWGPSLASRLARPVGARWGWPEGYVPLDAALVPPGRPAEVDGTFTLLNVTRQLGEPPDWEQAAASQLWRYHLHYWEWAWPLLQAGDPTWAREGFARMWRSWNAGTRFGRWDAWSPYVVSLRTWVLCGLHGSLVAGAEWERGFVDAIAGHAGYVFANVERDVGGNHLIKNLKALVGAGVFLQDERLISRGASELAKQIGIQVLADGGHYERSPSYHCQVLGDLLDIEALLAAAGSEPVPGLADAVQRMRVWLGAMTLPDGSVPLLNDCVPVDAERMGALGPIAPPDGPLIVLQPSGYVVIRKGPWHLIADVGPPCPPDLPAHAHADTLSFVLSVDGEPVIVDTGTSEYGDNPRRRYERSTAAHNTVEIDGQNSTEVWGAFRAGRLARPCLEVTDAMDDVVVLTGRHDGYRHLRGEPVHRRTWTVSPSTIDLVDEMLGDGQHDAALHLHTDGVCTIARSVATLGPIVAAVCDGVARLADDSSGDLTRVSAGFGSVVSTGCLEVRTAGVLPLRMHVRLSPVTGGSAATAHPPADPAPTP